MDELEVKKVELETQKTSELSVQNDEIKVEVIHKQSPSHTKCDRIGAQIRDMARMGLTRGNVAIAARISPYILDKYYADEYAAGEGEMRKGLATVAMAEALNGNTAILLHLVKTKLGWNETQLIQHSGEVRSVVSAKPLSKEEFAEKFLNKE
jgi:hypothetical protein